MLLTSIPVSANEEEVIAETVYDHKVRGKIILVATGYNTALFSKRNFGVKTTAFNIATKPINNIEEIYKNTVIFQNNVINNFYWHIFRYIF